MYTMVKNKLNRKFELISIHPKILVDIDLEH